MKLKTPGPRSVSVLIVQIYAVTHVDAGQSKAQSGAFAQICRPAKPFAEHCQAAAVEWQFKGADAWLKLDFKKDKSSKNEPPFSKGELRYRPATNDYELKVLTVQQKAAVYTGSLDDRKLTVERHEGNKIERLVVTILHSNRFLYRLDTRPADKSLFAMVWKVGATKEGESFATGDGGPECIVSGGKGTIAVAYQGKTYHVCCSGCRGEFLESPQKYIAEYEAKKAKKTK